MLVLLFAIIGLIVYGSLYPWHFQSAPGSPFRILLSSTQLVLDRFILRDIVLNLVLYVPLGFVGARVFRRFRFGFIWPILIGSALSVAIELAQVYTPTRRPSLMDVLCNAGGSCLGVIAASALELLFWDVTGEEARSPRWGALAVLLLWAALLMYPLFPVLGTTALYQKARLFTHIPFSWLTAISFCAIWVAAGMAGREVLPQAPGWTIFASVALVPAQLFVFGRQPEPAEFAGAAAGAALFQASRTRVNPAKWMLWVFPAVILLRGVAPLHFSATPQDFDWIPFGGLLESDWQRGFGTLLEKSFWYATAVWLVSEAGTPLRTASIWIAQLLAGIEIAQIWLPGRTPEITDPLLALAAGLVFWLLRERAV